jgi:hypothetical protein
MIRYDSPPYPASPLPPQLRFIDVDAAELAREEGEMRAAEAPFPSGARAWSAYLARLLPPVQPDAPERAGAPALLRTEAGMADFLASLGPTPARELALGLRALDRTGFWCGVQRQLDGLGYSAASA